MPEVHADDDVAADRSPVAGASTPSITTIIMRTKNRPELLARAVRNVVEQSSRAWELVVLNDGGDEEPVDAIVAEHADRFPTPPRVIHTRHSIGRDGVLNLALDHTGTDYLAIHDDDDTWAPTFLRATSDWLDAHPESAAVAVSTEVVLEKIADGEIRELGREPITIPHDTLSLFDLVLGNRIPPIGMVYRRDAALEAGGFDESLSVLGDWDFTLRVAARSHIGYLPGAPLAFWHQRPESEGDEANSVHGDLLLHLQTDRMLRDRALRAYIERHGVGGLLFISRFVDERVAMTEQALSDRIERLEARLTDEIADQVRSSAADQLSKIDGIVHKHVQHHSFAATLKRLMRRPRRRSR